MPESVPSITNVSYPSPEGCPVDLEMVRLLGELQEGLNSLSMEELREVLIVLPGIYSSAVNRFLLDKRTGSADVFQTVSMSKASEISGIPEHTLREMGRRGEIPTVHLGRSVTIRKSALEEFIKLHERGGYGLHQSPQRVGSGRLSRFDRTEKD